MRTIIVDDESLARDVLREYLAAHADVEIVAECANGFEAVKAITELAPDLVLLDIQMPKLDGFEVVGLIGDKTRYIFVTAYDQYALKAFEVHALDYLLKPFSQQRLDDALAQARARPLAPPPASLVQEAGRRDGPLSRVLIREGSQVHVVASARVDYVEAQGDYIRIHADGKAYMKHQRLSELETQLDATRFLRLHRSFLVNIERIARIEQAAKDSHVAILADGTRIPFSRSAYQALKPLLG